MIDGLHTINGFTIVVMVVVLFTLLPLLINNDKD
jgi:competence protein ComGC